jgi:thiol-disulfide isomerase/thioredoxin
MRFLAALLIAATLLAAAGCANLTGRNRDKDRTPPPPQPRNGDSPWWQEGTDTPVAKSKTKPPTLPRQDRETIIAGTVIDGRDGRPLKGVTSITVRATDAVAPAGGKGTDFETDADGYFIFAHLSPGKTYIVTAVREVDGRKLAAEMQVKPPAGNLRLVLSENQVSSLTPAPPQPDLGPFEPKEDPATIRPPTPPAPEPGTPVRRESVAGEPPPYTPPTAAIRPPPAPAPEPRRSDAPPAPTPPGPPMTRAPGNRVPNFVVADLLGGEWEFAYASGQLILMDFWGTTCGPCMRAVPGIKKLQADYGSSGLEIVAVACEAPAPFSARARDVDEVARKKELNYRVYLEREGKVGEIQRLFQIQWVPTLVLLDRQGTVLWRGGATDADLHRLEGIVKETLTKR